MRQGAPAVEQAGDGVRQERAAGRRSGHDVGLLEQLRRQHIEQILRQAPDSRRIPEQLMGIEVDPAVKPVVVVEMAIAHEHFERLQLFQRKLARILETIHRIGPLLSRMCWRPRSPTIVAATPPRSSQPSNGCSILI